MFDDHGTHGTLYTLAPVTRGNLDWEALLADAVAFGCGELIPTAEERIAAADELLAAALQSLIELGELASFASFALFEDECRRPLRRISAGVVRLLDRALAAHGRDVGYAVARWRADIALLAAAAAAMVDEPGALAPPLPLTLHQGARLIGDALVALPRDRIGVPELLAHAASEFLLVFAAASE